MRPDGSRWRLQSEKGGMFTAQLGHPTLKNHLFPSGKQAFLQNRSFASKDGWDRVLRPLVDVWGPLEKARGRDSTHPPKKKVISKNAFFLYASRSPEGAPQMAASPIDCIFTMPAGLTAYLQCPVRRPDRLHIYRVGGPRAPSHPVNMQSICSAADRGLEGAMTEFFPLPGGS